MATEIIPFANLQESGLEELAGAGPSSVNVVTDSRAAVRRRPGIREYAGAPDSVIDSAGIVGLHSTLGGKLIAVGAASPSSDVYIVDSSSATLLGQIDGGQRPTFAETEILLVLAAGAYPMKIELTGAYLMDYLGGTPPQATHVVAHNLRLSLNDVAVDRTKVNYSEQAIGTTDYSGHEQWPTSTTAAGGFYTAEARPDPVVAIGENTNEVFVWGQTTLQVFVTDPNLVYAAVPSREVGCGAPYSPIKVKESFAWLDHQRQFVRSDGRSVEVVGGNAIHRSLEGVTVSDCFGYRFLSGSVDALVWTLPTDGRTFVYQDGVGWGQWQSRVGGTWGQFAVTAHHLQAGTKKNLVGTADGRIGELTFDSQTDFGEAISAHVTTGFIDRGTSKKKRCAEVRLTLRRGEASGEPTGLLSWRDDLGSWEAPIEVSLGRSGDFETTVRLPSLGAYRTRQWRFQFDGEATLVLVKVEEDFEILEE